MFHYITKSPEETVRLAVYLSNCIQQGLVLCLRGDLGAGKTCFAQGLIHALGVSCQVVSPTFNIMNTYTTRLPIHHFDLYRLESEEELYEIGFFEYVEDREAVNLIEWPDRFMEILPENYILVDFERMEGNEQERIITFSLAGERDSKVFKELEKFC